MIKLIITSDSFPHVARHFKQQEIVIGAEHSVHADLKLPGLQERHIQIIPHLEKGRSSFFILNLANDPFVTLNNLPFRKQPIYGNDLIQVGDFSIHFSYEADNEDDSKSKGCVNSRSSIAVSRFNDYYLNKYDEDDETDGDPQEEKKSFIFFQFAKSWRVFLTLFSGFMSLIAVFASLIYLWVSDQTGEEETQAARGVADIAMSLTYAQLKHIHPQNQNWAHPEFIRNNLNSILAPNYIPLANVDAHGQFADCPYILRIYTSHDLSQFLVIAQPSPSLLQWLIPKASIIVDSRVMEMRKIKDLKALNRLIVSSNNLDGIHANEISNLVKQGELIPLSSLISKAENQGLSPPKALGLLRPGAQNFIYNAPRYYLLGETILNTSLDLVDNLGGMKEIGLLQQELAELFKFPDFVLYSSDGIQHALSTQKALATIIPKENFLIAYLQLNAHKKIINTHLLIDDSRSDTSITERTKPFFQEHKIEKKEVDENHLDQDLAFYSSSKDLAYQPEEKQSWIEKVDGDDPFFLQLTAVANLRHSSLKPVEEEITDLLDKHTLSAQSNFVSQFARLQQKYADTDREQRVKIFRNFHTITNQNASLSAAKFLEFVDAANLKVLFHEYLSNLKQDSKEHPITDNEIEQQFKLIQKSSSWQELERHVSQTCQLLQFDSLPEEGRLVAFQNTTRSLVTQKLNQFILSSTEALPSDAFSSDTFLILTNILKAVWITDPNTYDFYIDEFKLREQN